MIQDMRVTWNIMCMWCKSVLLMQHKEIEKGELFKMGGRMWWGRQATEGLQGGNYKIKVVSSVNAPKKKRTKRRPEWLKFIKQRWGSIRYI